MTVVELEQINPPVGGEAVNIAQDFVKALLTFDEMCQLFTVGHQMKYTVLMKGFFSDESPTETEDTVRRLGYELGQQLRAFALCPLEK